LLVLQQTSDIDVILQRKENMQVTDSNMNHKNFCQEYDSKMKINECLSPTKTWQTKSRRLKRGNFDDPRHLDRDQSEVGTVVLEEER
jgi:hypothetical protein